MFRELLGEHRGPQHVFNVDVSLEETLRRHDERPIRSEVAPDRLPERFVPRDLLGVTDEIEIQADRMTSDRVAGKPPDAVAGPPSRRSPPCPHRARRSASRRRSPLGRRGDGQLLAERGGVGDRQATGEVAAEVGGRPTGDHLATGQQRDDG